MIINAINSKYKKYIIIPSTNEYSDTGSFFLNNKAARIIVSFIKKTINIIAKSNSAALLIH
ncbi:hypothetical protein [Morganella phage IME1369_01]|nr:hypothetical protein [Morganella phage IME1369_01]